ncbi:MAG TPA: non-homologous end-joining DNA ligase [Pyrinomonadaceae bacterium]|nr:non-homologous end-joining DNA ligase [Pyrinomonadaceae bacterium]
MPRQFFPTREFHPVEIRRSPTPPLRSIPSLKLPKAKGLEVDVGGRIVKLTNLDKPFWPKLGITKRDLLQYYIDIAPFLLPHIRERAMVMKRYPNGAAGDFFFMKRAPSPRPSWIEICSIEHESENIIDFPMIQDLPSLMWVINLGCIDLNQWYATCDDVDRPDYLHFDLDPVPGASFEKVVEAALLLKTALDSLKMPSYAKTTGSKGIHIYIPIRRGPTQKQVWMFAKEFSHAVASQMPDLLTAVYKVSKRPKGRVLVDYNQNAWGRTLASIYSVRPTALATVSTPVKWRELEKGIKIDQFRIDNVPARLRKVGDLWKPLLAKRGRFLLETYL